MLTSCAILVRSKASSASATHSLRPVHGPRGKNDFESWSLAWIYRGNTAQLQVCQSPVIMPVAANHTFLPLPRGPEQTAPVAGTRNRDRGIEGLLTLALPSLRLVAPTPALRRRSWMSATARKGGIWRLECERCPTRRGLFLQSTS